MTHIGDATFTTRCFMVAAQVALHEEQLQIVGGGTSILTVTEFPVRDNMAIALALETHGYVGELATGIGLLDPDGEPLRHDRFLDTVHPSEEGLPRLSRWARNMPLTDITRPGNHTLVWLIEGQEHDRLQFGVELTG